MQINANQILRVKANAFEGATLYWVGGPQNVYADMLAAGEEKIFGPYVDVARLGIVGSTEHEIVNRSNPVPTLLADVINSESPAAPVTSVNSKTGDVVLNASDVGALPNTYTPPQGVAVADATAGTEVDTINALLLSLRNANIIAT